MTEWILDSERHTECTIEQNIGRSLINRKIVHSLPSTIVNSSFWLFSSFHEICQTFPVVFCFSCSHVTLTELCKWHRVPQVLYQLIDMPAQAFQSAGKKSPITVITDETVINKNRHTEGLTSFLGRLCPKVIYWVL